MKKAKPMKTLKSVGVLSVAKMAGVMHVALGFLVAPVFLMMGMIGSIAGHPVPFGAIGGVALAVIAPILYGVMAFIIGAIMALLYNLVAKWTGGIELEVQSSNPGYSSPPGQM
jgi:membrane protease YdiL (CAAX protease family)